MFEAIENGDLAALEDLIDGGADVDQWDGFGVPALTRAFEARSLDLARRLLDAGASAAPRCTVQHRPLRALIEMFPKAEGQADRDTAEPFDAERALAMVWELLVKGAEARDRHLLSAAVMADEPELIRLLVDAGADWRQPTETGASLIGLAVSCGAPKVFDLLLEWGAAPPADGEDGGEDDDQEDGAGRAGAVELFESTGEGFEDEAWDDREDDEFDDQDAFVEEF